MSTLLYTDEFDPDMPAGEFLVWLANLAEGQPGKACTFIIVPTGSNPEKVALKLDARIVELAREAH